MCCCYISVKYLYPINQYSHEGMIHPVDFPFPHKPFQLFHPMIRHAVSIKSININFVEVEIASNEALDESEDHTSSPDDGSNWSC